MTASGFGANQVTSIGWRWNAPQPQGAGAPVAQSVATTGNLKVFLKDTTSDAAGLIGTFIDTNGVGYTKVIDATISITRTDTLEFTVDVAAGGPGTSPFTPNTGEWPSGDIHVPDHNTTCNSSWSTNSILYQHRHNPHVSITNSQRHNRVCIQFQA